MASQDNVETIKTDKTASEHDQDPNTATLQSGKSWVTSATEGEMAPQAWYYTWRAMRDRFYPHYVFYPQDPRFWDDDAVYWDNTLPVGYDDSYNSVTRMPMNRRLKADTESSTSHDRRQSVYRKSCTFFLVVMGILFLLTATIPVLLHVFLGKEPDNINPEAVVHTTLEIENLKYSPDMSNTSHPKFKDVEQSLRKEIDELFSKSDIKRYYKGSAITKTRNASSNTQVFLDLHFKPVDRKIPFYRQLTNILHSVPRDVNDSRLGVLGKYRFRIDSLDMVDTELLYSLKKTTDEINEMVTFPPNETITQQPTETTKHANESYDFAKDLIKINISPDQKDTRIQRPISHTVIDNNSQNVELDLSKQTTTETFTTLSLKRVSAVTNVKATDLDTEALNETTNATDSGEVAEHTYPANSIDNLANTQAGFDKALPNNNFIIIAGGRGKNRPIKRITSSTVFETTLKNRKSVDVSSNANADISDITQSMYNTTHLPAEFTNHKLNTFTPNMTDGTRNSENKNVKPFRNMESLNVDYPKHLSRGAFTTNRLEVFDPQLLRDGIKETTTEQVTLISTENNNPSFNEEYTASNDLADADPYVTDFQNWYDVYETTEYNQNKTFINVTDSFTSEASSGSTASATASPTTIYDNISITKQHRDSLSKAFQADLTAKTTEPPDIDTASVATELIGSTDAQKKDISVVIPTPITSPVPWPTTLGPNMDNATTYTDSVATSVSEYPEQTKDVESMSWLVKEVMNRASGRPLLRDSSISTASDSYETHADTMSTRNDKTNVDDLDMFTASSNAILTPTTEFAPTTSPTTSNTGNFDKNSAVPSVVSQHLNNMTQPLMFEHNTGIRSYLNATDSFLSITPTTKDSDVNHSTTVSGETSDKTFGDHTPLIMTGNETNAAGVHTVGNFESSTDTNENAYIFQTPTRPLIKNKTVNTQWYDVTTTGKTALNDTPLFADTNETIASSSEGGSYRTGQNNVDGYTSFNYAKTGMTDHAIIPEVENERISTATDSFESIETSKSRSSESKADPSAGITNSYSITESAPNINSARPDTATVSESKTYIPSIKAFWNLATDYTRKPAESRFVMDGARILYNEGIPHASDPFSDSFLNTRIGLNTPAEDATYFTDDELQISNPVTERESADLAISTTTKPNIFTNTLSKTFTTTSLPPYTSTLVTETTITTTTTTTPTANHTAITTIIPLVVNTAVTIATSASAATPSTTTTSPTTPNTTTTTTPSTIPATSTTTTTPDTIATTSSATTTTTATTATATPATSTTTPSTTTASTTASTPATPTTNTPATSTTIPPTSISTTSATTITSTTTATKATTQYMPHIKYLWNVGLDLLSGLKQPDSKWEDDKPGNTIDSMPSGQAIDNKAFKVFDKSDILQPKETLVVSNVNSPVAFSNIPNSDINFTPPTDKRSKTTWRSEKEITFVTNSVKFTLPEQVHAVTTNTKTTDAKLNDFERNGAFTALNPSDLRSDKRSTSEISNNPFDISNQLERLPSNLKSVTKAINWLSPINLKSKQNAKSRLAEAMIPANITESSTRTTQRIADIVHTAQTSRHRSTVGGPRRKVNVGSSVMVQEPEITFTIDGSAVTGSFILLSWKLTGIRGWSNIVFDRIRTNGESERITSISPAFKIPASSLALDRFKVFRNSHLTADNGTIMIEIRELKCDDEGTYIARVMSKGVPFAEQRNQLTVFGPPDASVVIPDDVFEGHPITGVKCIASLGYPPGKLFMRIKYPNSTTFINTIVEDPTHNISQPLSRTCGPVVVKKFEDVLDVNKDLNNTIVQCGITGTSAIKSRAGVVMSKFKYIRIIPDSVCSSPESSLIPHPFIICSAYIDCPSKTVKSCPEETCFDPELGICSRKQTVEFVN